MFTIKYNRTTNHIAGAHALTVGSGEVKDGVVGYYPENPCGTLTRSRLATGPEFKYAGDALEAARKLGGRKLCKRCERAMKLVPARQFSSEFDKDTEKTKPVADATPTLPDGWKEVHHVRTGEVVGWLRPGTFRPVEDGMPTV